MRKLLMLAVMAVFLSTELAPTQILQNARSRRSPNVDSLRHALKLSPDLHLDWIKGPNGVDTFRVADNFNRSSIGSNWDASGYWQIHNGELGLTSDAQSEWRYLATFLPVYNTPQRHIYSVSYRWGKNADALGVREGAMALMLDNPSTQGTGYWLWHRYASVWLWIIKNGTWEYTPGEGKQVDRQDGISTGIRAGDVVTGYIRQQSDAVYFDYYVNGDFDATVKDVTKEFPKNNTWYMGAFLHGQNLNNNIDDFTITWLEGNVTPVAVTDLHAVDSTASSIQLEWTSTGDNGLYAHANRLELRYSQSPISLGNFAKAALVPNLPAPAASGVKQRVNVTGLNTSTTYYFALKIFDNNGYASALSNLAKTQTAREGIPSKLAAVSGNGQIVSIDKTALLPLVARLTDQYDNPSVSNMVVFNIVSGGGYFLKGSGKVYPALTDSSGQASSRVVASEIYGDTTKITAAWTSSIDGTKLMVSFLVVAARPDSVAAIKGNNQTAMAGKALPESLVVKIFDAAGGAVKNYPATFRILTGGGTLAKGQTQVEVATDSGGYARTIWTLGALVGEQQVEVNSLFNGKNLRHTPFVVKATALGTTDVQEEVAVVPQQFALPQNFPNPFNPTTTIRFDLPEAGQVEMNLYDLNGRRVRQLLAAFMPAGSHRLLWNGQDDNGRPADSGVYFLVLRANLGHASNAVVARRKVILLK